MNHICLKTVLRRAVPTWLAVGLVLTAPVCSVLASSKTVILTTTTSTQDSGLLDVLVPLFEKQTGYSVKTVSVGTGQALALGGRGVGPCPGDGEEVRGGGQHDQPPARDAQRFHHRWPRG